MYVAYYLVDFRHRQTDGQTDRETESDTYELTVLIAQVSSKKYMVLRKFFLECS